MEYSPICLFLCKKGSGGNQKCEWWYTYINTHIIKEIHIDNKYKERVTSCVIHLITIFSLSLSVAACSQYRASFIFSRIPGKTYMIIAFLTVGTMGLSNTSLGYLNYPTQVIFKCCKLIPVMIGGVFIQGTLYSCYLIVLISENNLVKTLQWYFFFFPHCLHVEALVTPKCWMNLS